MLVGEEAKVRIINMLSESLAEVENTKDGSRGLLRIKGRLKITDEGIVNAWVIHGGRRNSQIVYGNSYFGKYSISKGITEKYSDVLLRLLNTPEAINPDDISILKGMVNRCLRRDQWDWYTTYLSLGCPSRGIMKSFVNDTIKIRKDLIQGNRKELVEFRQKYDYFLSSMTTHLKLQDIGEEENIPLLDAGLWNQLQPESRRNLTIAENVGVNESKYILMHCFVTIEQEFYVNYLQDYIRKKGSRIQDICYDRRYRITHEVLTGNSHFSLGTIYHLGKFIQDSKAFEASRAIREYAHYLGYHKGTAVELCNRISSVQIDGRYLTQIRNGLAHGDKEITNTINQNTYRKMKEILYSPPHELLRRLMEGSVKDTN